MQLDLGELYAGIHLSLHRIEISIISTYGRWGKMSRVANTVTKYKRTVKMNSNG